MRRLRTWWVATAAVAVLAPLLVAVVGSTSAEAAEQYRWSNVRIDGGGFVPGIVFNRKEPDLLYARTDIGGAYRWEPKSGTWTPLLDWVGQENFGYNGVLSLASDPVDPDRVYAAVGMYTNSWDPNNGAILRSTDRGATWKVSELPFKNGGNMPGRGMGERLAVDPKDNSRLFFAAEGGNGLWRSTDYGATWTKVTAFPNPGNYVQNPADTNDYLNQNQGLTWVTFDETSRDVYVGVADKENPLYRSTDGGATWARIPGGPTGVLPHKGVLDTVNHYLYVSTSDTGGPYDGATGGLWRLNTATGTWTDISPAKGSDAYFGYSGLTVDRKKPGTLIVASQISWWPDAIFFRSTDSGATWTRIWDFDGYPNRKNRYKQDISANPWLSFNSTAQLPETTPKLGWMTESVEIDPFNSDRMLYGTGATIYGTNDLTNWDAGTPFTIKPMAQGLEETNVLDLAAPPTGGPLVSALGDIGGFVHTDLTKVPAKFHDTPSLSSNTSIDFAELDPKVFVRVGNADTGAHIGVSNDGGKTWYAGQEPGGVTGGGTVAVGADANAVVWAPVGADVHWSTTRGSSWTRSTGIPAGARVESDRVNPKIFYGYAAGKFYTSKDGGATFTASAAAMPATGRVHLAAVPGLTGNVWLAGETGLLRSTDAGATFTAVGGLTSAINVAFGKAAPGATHPAVYAVSGSDVLRSDDTGASFVRINDDAHRYGNMGDALAGDPNVYGRVYLGTNGRGIIYADRLGGTTPTSPSASVSTKPSPSISPSKSSSPSASPSVSPSRSTSPSPSSAAPSISPSSSGPATSGGCTATYKVTGQWNNGFQGEVTVRNTGTTALTGWSVGWSFGAGQTLQQVWGGTATQSGAAVKVGNVSWNGTLAPNSSTTFGFLASWDGTNPVPSPTQCTTSS